MSRMSELHADIHARGMSDLSFDVYRLEAVTDDLRGHHPDDLDGERIAACIKTLSAIVNAGKESGNE